MDKIRSVFATALVSFGGALSALADDPVIDTTAATTALTSIKDALTAWVTSAVPILLAVAGSFLVFWLVKLAIRIIKSFGSSAK